MKTTPYDDGFQDGFRGDECDVSRWSQPHYMRYIDGWNAGTFKRVRGTKYLEYIKAFHNALDMKKGKSNIEVLQQRKELEDAYFNLVEIVASMYQQKMVMLGVGRKIEVEKGLDFL